MNRPSWDEHFLGIAEKVAEMGTCGRKKVGAVLVNSKNEIISTGFNGSPRGLDHCTNKDIHICRGGCLNGENRCVRAVHAELNAILVAKDDLTDATMYCTDEPCENCTKYIVQKGIRKVVFKNEYPNKYNQYFNQNLIWVHYNSEVLK